MMQVAQLAGLVQQVVLPTFTDHRGTLTPITFADWGFEAVRSFVVTAPAGSVRGGHAHRTCRQVLMRVSGIVEVEVRLGDAAQTVRLDDATPAILVEPGVWAQQRYLTADAALVVFADTPYDPDDYVGSVDAGTDVLDASGSDDVDDEMDRLALGVSG